MEFREKADRDLLVVFMIYLFLTTGFLLYLLIVPDIGGPVCNYKTLYDGDIQSIEIIEYEYYPNPIDLGPQNATVYNITIWDVLTGEIVSLYFDTKMDCLAQVKIGDHLVLYENHGDFECGWIILEINGIKYGGGIF